MYNPQQTVPAYTKPSQRPTGFPWRLVLLTGVILVMAIVVYAGMLFGYQPYLEKQLASVDAELGQLTSSLQADQSEVFAVYSQLYNINTILQGHTLGSKIFTLLETGTRPGVQLTSASVDMEKQSVTLQGQAPDHDAAVNQAAAYGTVPGVLHSRLVGSAIGSTDPWAHFTIELTLEKDYFTP